MGGWIGGEKGGGIYQLHKMNGWINGCNVKMNSSDIAGWIDWVDRFLV